MGQTCSPAHKSSTRAQAWTGSSTPGWRWMAKGVRGREKADGKFSSFAIVWSIFWGQSQHLLMNVSEWVWATGMTCVTLSRPDLEEGLQGTHVLGYHTAKLLELLTPRSITTHPKSRSYREKYTEAVPSTHWKGPKYSIRPFTCFLMSNHELRYRSML